MDFLHRFLFDDFWVPVWPNVAAAVLGWAWINWRQKVRQARHHEELKQHITHTVNKALKGATSDDFPG